MTELKTTGSKEKPGALKPAFSVIIATRDRPDLLAQAVASVLRNPGQDYELIIIDQSREDATRQALARYEGDSRLIYLRNDRPGVSRNRNLGIRQARGEIIAITDDDCTVGPDWLSALAEIFRSNPNLGVLFGRVSAAAHNRQQGFIPVNEIEQEGLYRRTWDILKVRGIGACMVFRKRTWEETGGFDEALGPGGILRSAEEGDFALRSLMKRWEVLVTPRINVVHYGFRTFEDGSARELVQRDWFGLGAAYFKFARSGHPIGLCLMLQKFFIVALYQQILPNLLKGQRPLGLSRLCYFLKGAWASLKIPVDKNYCLYRER